MKFHVQLSRVTREYLSFNVEAADEAQARRVARKYARENADDFCDGQEGKIRIEELRPATATGDAHVPAVNLESEES